MKIVDAGYELLFILAMCDKIYHAKEVKSIESFLATHFDSFVKIDITKIHNNILMLNTEQRLSRLISVADYFKDKTTLKSKLIMTNYALDLIIADGKVTDEERLRFKLLGEFWNVDLDRHINKRLNKNG
ncbi:MAG: hypothetical protein U9P72_11690 [Campylobacterota bacterium]|nr:hypothetical protein [Campylobacterota bacterium]